jgi:hypothetical protein
VADAHPTSLYTEVPRGALAQLGERRLCKAEVAGSIPARSTRERPANAGLSYTTGDRSARALVRLLARCLLARTLGSTVVRFGQGGRCFLRSPVRNHGHAVY